VQKKKINNFIFFFLLVRAINQRIMADSNHERKAHEKRLAEDPLPFEPSSPTPLPPGEQALVLWASLLALFLLYLPHTIVHQTTGTHLFNIALRRPEFVALLASFSGTIGPSTHTLTTSLSTPVTTEAIFLSALNTVGALPATIEAAPFTRAFRSEVLIPVSPLARLRALALLIHKTDLLCRCNAALTLNVVRVLTALWNSTIPDVLEDFMGVLLDPSPRPNDRSPVIPAHGHSRHPPPVLPQPGPHRVGPSHRRQLHRCQRHRRGLNHLHADLQSDHSRRYRRPTNTATSASRSRTRRHLFYASRRRRSRRHLVVLDNLQAP
jgi:hypothetical protein